MRQHDCTIIAVWSYDNTADNIYVEVEGDISGDRTLLAVSNHSPEYSDDDPSIYKVGDRLFSTCAQSVDPDYVENYGLVPLELDRIPAATLLVLGQLIEKFVHKADWS